MTVTAHAGGATAVTLVGTPRPDVRRRTVEWLALLASPAIVFFLVQARPMAIPDSIDQSFYTAYAQHGADLVSRFGVGGYFWVRLGFILPARACYLAFGALGGFYTFRYLLALLAVVPAYLLFRRLYGVGAGAVVVVAILASPVVLATWGSDYPDSAALSYLIGGGALLVLPAGGRRRRLGLVAAAGVLFTLAVHCQVVDVPLVAAPVLGYVLVYLRRRTVRPVLADLLVLAVAAVVVTGVLAGIAWLWLGHADILSPTWRNYWAMRSPGQLALWHSGNWRWVRTVPYVLVPPGITLAWCALRLRRRGVAREEVAVGVGRCWVLRRTCGCSSPGRWPRSSTTSTPRCCGPGSA